MKTDHPITEEIRAALAVEPNLHNAKEIAVSEAAGTVTLRGTVRSMHQRRTAVEVAKSMRGVQRVEDLLQIDPRDQVKDAELRGAALQALIDDDRIPDQRIDVTVSAGWVTIKGAVKHQEDSDSAFHAVSQLPGVGGITNRIEVVTSGVDG
jgi:osmotically-inducible protein OsmY